MKWTIAALYGVSLTVWQTGAGAACVSVPPAASSPLAVACDDGNTYSITVAGIVHQWNKDVYQAALRNGIVSWLGGEASRYGTAQTEVWLSVPEANPAAASIRVQVLDQKGDAPTFVVSLEMEPSAWAFANDAVAIMGPERYPASYGHRAGEILVKPRAGRTTSETATYLAPFGATAPLPLTQAWSLFHTSVFQEAAVRAAVELDQGHAAEVEKIDYNQVVEWIAQRGEAFAFPLFAPN